MIGAADPTAGLRRARLTPDGFAGAATLRALLAPWARLDAEAEGGAP